MRSIWFGLVSLGCGMAAAFWGCGDQPEAPTGPTSGPSSVAASGAGGTGGTGGTGGAGKGGADGGTTSTGGSDGGTTSTGGSDGGTTSTGGATTASGTGGATATGTGGATATTSSGGGNDAGADSGTDGGTCTTGTDVDCGGTCPMACVAGQKCLVDADCTTGVCGVTTHKCTLNGCDPAAAVNLTGAASVTVNFAANAYTPSCLLVDVGTKVTFAGNFATFPLQGGTVQGTTGTPAASGTTPLPTPSPQSTGMNASFTFSSAGSFGFYCTTQIPAGMMGAVFVN